MKRFLLAAAAWLCAAGTTVPGHAKTPLLSTTLPEDTRLDSIRTLETEEVVIRSSSKETNNLWSVPEAVSLITPAKINNRQIESVKDLSAFVPNLFIPDYGSKLTTPIYLRGVGARSSGQSVGMYVDNIPYMDKSTFDFEFMDIQRIEVLRGPQGTLYGRNAMGGIINVYTLSPLEYQGHRLSVGGGNYGTWNAKISKLAKFGDRVGLSVGAYYEREGGYFRNEFTGKKADEGQSAGGKLKLEWKINPRLRAMLASSFDFTDQGAFAYGLYDKESHEINPVNYNDQGSYLRRMSNSSVRFEYRTDKILLTSNTGYQWLDDDMRMDQDFTPANIFTINQRQRQHSVNQEIAVRSVKQQNYQWSAGAFAFYNHLTTDGDVLFKEDGIRNILQPVFDAIQMPVALTIRNSEIPNPGTYRTPAVGAAVFHQSTFNDLLTEGLSLTLGLRLDYEKQYLKYNTSMAIDLLATNKPGGIPMLPPAGVELPIDKTLTGRDDQDFLQWLPKVSLKYECTPEIMTYFTAAKGYKAGGYNIQMFSEVMQDSLRAARPAMGGGGRPGAAAKAATPVAGGEIRNALAYKPEQTWNYELGTRGRFWDGRMNLELALFLMDIRDVQLTQFVNGGSGRILTNAGKGRSYGVEATVELRPVTGLSIDLNYGFTHATFRDYDGGTNAAGESINYRGKFIPYVPQHTFSAGAAYTLNLPQRWVDRMTFAAQYTGAGRIYWNEANDVQQPFYGLLNAKVSFRHDFVRLELWARNILDTDYGAFYFESFGNSFIQRGKPFTCGANLVFAF
ncbi:TonB-dependent receptor [uncultured Rikenella sp.]|uniref:TonB-dependent receptor n=1 Tax=uncultured Rikenella sp. TaxID=368003 RepID=UPI0026266C92|nr:TonB-dependent receptor [uncultured Rikenella sp.]